MMLTAVQMKTYQFVRSVVADTGRPPTYRQIADEMRQDVSVAHSCVTRICERGYLSRAGGKIHLERVLAPCATREFDYFAVDYENLRANGWPRLVDVGPQ